MRHKVAGRGFSRTANQRKALLRGLVASLFERQRIETTLARAKEIKSISERIISFAKRGDLASRRLALAYVGNKGIVATLFEKIAPRIKDRNGGYLRIVKTRNRSGDSAPMAVIEFTDIDVIKKEEKVEEKKEAK